MDKAGETNLGEDLMSGRCRSLKHCEEIAFGGRKHVRNTRVR